MACQTSKYTFVIGDWAIGEAFVLFCFICLFEDILDTPKIRLWKNSLSCLGRKKKKAILILAFHNESPEVYMGIIKTKNIKNNKNAGPISVVTGHWHHMT